MSDVLFKKGNRIVTSTDDTMDVTHGKVYTVTKDALNVVHFKDDDGFPRYRPGNLYEVIRKTNRDYVADHARRTLRKAGLSKEEARQVVENWEHDDFPLSTLSRKLPDRLSVLLMGAFRWSASPQGFEYWDAVFERERTKEHNAQAQ